MSVADPGFSIMGGGGSNVREGRFSVKMKELGPIGEWEGRAPSPGSANE